MAIYETSDGKQFEGTIYGEIDARRHQSELDEEAQKAYARNQPLIYRTSDGLEWDNEGDAQRHENYLTTGTKRYVNGDTYTGEMYKKSHHGWGKYTWASGAVYEGLFKYGKRHGIGTFIKNGDKISVDWIDDKKHGKGKIEKPDGTVIKGKWENDELVKGSEEVIPPTDYKNLLILAEQGNPDAMYEIGYAYRYGEGGINKDRAKSDEWFNKAFNSFIKEAEQGNLNAVHKLGKMYEYGYYVEEDISKAAEWYLKAAEKGHIEAQDGLGTLYRSGPLKDHVKAFEWWLKAAEQGYPRALFNVASCYAKGEGVTKDINKAIEWYKKSAALGNDTAEYCIKKLTDADHKEVVKEIKKSTQSSNSPSSSQSSYNTRGDTRNGFVSVLLGLVCGSGAFFTSMWFLQMILGKITSLLALLGMLAVGIFVIVFASKAWKNRKNALFIILLLIGIYGWLYIFGLNPDPVKFHG
jgi:hypothetical protein